LQKISSKIDIASRCLKPKKEEDMTLERGRKKISDHT